MAGGVKDILFWISFQGLLSQTSKEILLVLLWGWVESTNQREFEFVALFRLYFIISSIPLALKVTEWSLKLATSLVSTPARDTLPVGPADCRPLAVRDFSCSGQYDPVQQVP